MKKLALILTLALLLVTLVACSNSNESTDPTPSTSTSAAETNPSDSEDSIEIPATIAIPASFREVPSSENILEAYRAEVEYRSSQEDYFTYEERVFLDAKGYDARTGVIQEYDEFYGELYEYYYPVVYRVDADDFIIIYSEGRLDVEALSYDLESKYEVWEYVHNPELTEEEELLACKPGYSTVYNQTTGNVSFWEFGEKKAEYQVPKGSVYTGWSYWEGYLFRSGTNVYAVHCYCHLSSTEEAGVYLLAENVEQVILADYYAGSDEWSQPLFLMTDGTLKVYCSWYGDSNAPVGDPCHLQEIRCEGGYSRSPD